MKIKDIVSAIFLFFVLLNPSLAQTTTASLLPNGKQTFLDSNGNPLTSGKVYFYIPNTTVFKTTWQDASKLTANANPVNLDAAGRAIIYGDGSYRQIVRDRNGNLIWDANTSSAGTGGGGGGSGDGVAVGTIVATSNLTPPVNYLFTYGQEVSRTTYSDLLEAITITQNVTCTSGSSTLSGMSDTSQIPNGAVIESSCAPSGATVISKTSITVTMSANSSLNTTATGTFFPYGNGNASTTFNLPDLRGNAIIGRTNMGGTASTNLTSTFYGSNPQATGAVGGSQSRILVTANLPAYTPSGTVGISDTRTWAMNGGLPTTTGTGIQGGTTIGQGANTVIVNSGTITGSFTGAAQGGISAAIAIIPPAITFNYIIKAIADTGGGGGGGGGGVLSIGGMIGNIACGSNLTCIGNTISATGTGSGTVTSVASGTGLIGGPITTSGSLSVVYGTTAGTSAQGNDARIANAIQNNLTSGNIIVGDGTNTAAPVAVSGDATLSNAGALTVTKTSGVAFGTMATQNASSVSITGGTITGMPNPSANSDVANKAYVDATASGLNPLAASKYATAAALPTNSYSNGTLGVGATITVTATGTLTVDGSVTALNDVIIVKNEATQANNGIYIVTTAGAVGVQAVLTRVTYFDQAAEMIKNSYSSVSSGSINAGSSFILQNAVTTVGTTAVVWVTFSSFSSIIAMSQGGTGANLTPSNGGIFYSNATTGAVLAGTITARQMLQSGASSAPAWSTATWPATTIVNNILFSSATNVVGQIATVNGGILNANSSGVPAMTVTPTLGVAGTSAGALVMAGLTSGNFTQTVPNAAGTWTFKWPNGVPSVTGQALTADTSGNASWTTINSMPTIADKTFLANTSGSTALPVSTSITTYFDSAACNTKSASLNRLNSTWGCNTVVANVQNYGAVGNGSTDDTAAIQAAVNTGLPVYLPATYSSAHTTFCYKTTSAITMATPGQKFYGDGITGSAICPTAATVGQQGILNYIGGELGPIFQDFRITCAQSSTTSSLGALTNYPPAFYLQAAPRTRMFRVRIGTCITGIDMRGNAGGSVLDDIENGALTGVLIDGSLDTIEISGHRSWPFENPGGSNLQNLFFANGVSMQIGRVDGLQINNSMSIWNLGLNLFSGASGPPFVNVSNFDFDSFNGIACAGGNSFSGTSARITVSSSIFTIAGTGSHNPITITNGCVVNVSNSEFFSGISNKPLVQLTDGAQGVFANNTFWMLTDTQAFSQASASGTSSVTVTGNRFLIDNPALARSFPIFDISGGRSNISNNSINDTSVGTNTFLSISGGSFHRVIGNSAPGWTGGCTVLTGAVYSLNNIGTC